MILISFFQSCSEDKNNDKNKSNLYIKTKTFLRNCFESSLDKIASKILLDKKKIKDKTIKF